MPDNQACLLKVPTSPPWNKGKLIGAKPPLRPKHVWSIRTHLMIERRTRDLAMFNLAIESKLRGCDVVALKVEDVAPNGYTIDRATVRQRKTGRPVKFELTDRRARLSMTTCEPRRRSPANSVTGSGRNGQGMTTRQYARLVSRWVASIGLDAKLFGTHSLRGRTKATLICRRTGNLRAVQLLLGHTKILEHGQISRHRGG